MSQIIAVVGMSGTGKSRSIKSLNPKETYLINCDLKPLPFKSDDYNSTNKNYYETSDIEMIKQIINGISQTRPDIKNIVIDTLNSVMSDKEMSDEFASRSKGGEAMKKWMELAMDIYNLNNMIKKIQRKDLLVFELYHEGLRNVKQADGSDYDIRCIISNGRKLEKIQLEKDITTVLFTRVSKNSEGKNKYLFETQANYSTAKSPEGLFDTDVVDNDLSFVESQIRKFYNM